MSQEDKFIWNVQMAGYEHSRADKKGETDFQNFQKAFDLFPWNEQIKKANQFPDKASPPITISDLKNGKDFGISMAENGNEYGYIIVDEKNITSKAKIFAGGDIAGCKGTVAWAARSGRDAANSIGEYLKNI